MIAKNFRILGLMIAALMALGSSGYAQTSVGSPQASAGSITDLVMAKRRHLDEYLRLMKDSNPGTRMAALEQALKDNDPVVRGVALASFLKRFTAITPEVVLDKGSQIAQQDVPYLVIKDLSWSDDGTSATGAYFSPCSSNPPARVQIAGGRIVIQYDGVCLRPALLGLDTGGNDAKARAETLVACRLTLTPNADDTSLDGPLQCVGMPTQLSVQLPFGP